MEQAPGLQHKKGLEPLFCLVNNQSPQDFVGLFCDSCGLKFLISQNFTKKLLYFLGVCCDEFAGAIESCDKKLRISLFVIFIELFG